MKTLCLALVSLIFVVLLSTAVNLQTPAEPFVSEGGRFALATHEQPYEDKDAGMMILKFELRGRSMSWKPTSEGFANVSYYEVGSYEASGETFTISSAQKNEVVQGYKKRFLDELKEANIMSAESPFVVDGFNGVEIRGIKSGKLVSRFFFSNGRFYILSAVGPDTESYQNNLDFLGTFRPLPKAEYIAVRIARNTPAPVPQETRKSRPMSDAAENGLKGSIKYLVIDAQDSPKETRERSSEEYYDQFGDLTKTIEYMGGYPTDINIWGWIEGMRVNKMGHIGYGQADGPNEKGIINLMEAPDAAPDKKPHPPRDDRFSNRYEYKYDTNGRMAERSMFENDGSPWMRTTFKYLVGKREETVYDKDGKFNYRTTFVLDKSGNVSEEMTLDEKGRVESDTIYKYEFDGSGNWTVRRSFEKKRVKGRVALVPGEVEFRTLTYY